MKTSNKLLIAFAASLILLPILGMVYSSQVLYTDAKNWKAEARKDDSFSQASANMESKTLSAFQSVNIANGKGMYFNIRLIKDDKYGVKIPNNDKDLIKLEVDAQGKLQVTLNDKGNENRYVTLLIYAPDTKSISLEEADGVALNAKADSLAISLKKVNRLVFDGETAISKLSVATEDVSEVNIEKEIAKSLYLNLKNTAFTSEWASYQDLNITTAGNSTITVKGDDRQAKGYSIQNLTLNTTETAKINLENMTVSNCKGSLSDQTLVSMPAVNLKQLFNK
ncbi:hypothetical protein VRU48_13820 [Pedobacter sp. KR3-3]|uniref:Auto-transporter adhesin head GIN domain-containing protein n=1 Tax=Pedobacter albus TaxID=3113905 RepID=A0ABU7IA88_9SPHI|nr:hypothetical protein [Pedobacter sp. KR3-3]MEE1946196.1 hypothetical protein [Pedobacter sp. KR3-3]